MYIVGPVILKSLLSFGRLRLFADCVWKVSDMTFGDVAGLIPASFLTASMLTKLTVCDRTLLWLWFAQIHICRLRCQAYVLRLVPLSFLVPSDWISWAAVERKSPQYLYKNPVYIERKREQEGHSDEVYVTENQRELFLSAFLRVIASPEIRMSFCVGCKRNLVRGELVGGVYLKGKDFAAPLCVEYEERMSFIYLTRQMAQEGFPKFTFKGARLLQTALFLHENDKGNWILNADWQLARLFLRSRKKHA